MRVLRTTGLLALVLAVAPSASATHSNGPAPKLDFVQGTGSTLNASAHVDAKSGPSGEDPRGHLRIEFFGIEVSGRVTCLNTLGNLGRAEGVIEKSNAAFLPPGGMLEVKVVDNGEPGDADSFGVSIAASPPAPGCPLPATGFLTTPIQQGNFVVHDAAP